MTHHLWLTLIFQSVLIWIVMCLNCFLSLLLVAINKQSFSIALFDTLSSRDKKLGGDPIHSPEKYV